MRAAPAKPSRGALRSGALRAGRREARLSSERLLRPTLLPGPREHRARRQPRLARTLPYSSRGRMRPPLPPNSTTPGQFRKIRIRPRPIPIHSCTFSSADSRREGGRGGYRCQIRPRHHARREAPLARRGGVPGLRPDAQRGRDGAAAQRQELRARQDRFYADGRLRIDAKPAILTATFSSSSNALQDLTQPTLKSRAAMTFSSTTITRATSIRTPTLPLFRQEPKQPPFDVSWSFGRICFFVTRRSCFSTTTSKFAPKRSALLPRNDGRKTRSCAAGADREFGHRLFVPEKTFCRPWHYADLVGRDHGASANPPRARMRGTGRSPNRSAAGAATCSSDRRCARLADR